MDINGSLSIPMVLVEVKFFFSPIQMGEKWTDFVNQVEEVSWWESGGRLSTKYHW